MISCCLRLRCQGREDTVQVEPGEAPFERRGDCAVAVTEGEERRRERLERGEVVGVEDLALNDAEVQLDLVEPGGVDRRVDDPDLRPALAEPRFRARTPVRAAVVDDPEDPAGTGIGFLAHHLVDEAPEGHDARARLTAPEDLGPVDVPGGEVGERAAPLVLVLDPTSTTRPGQCPRVDPGAGLDAGLLVGTDDVLVGPQRFPLPAAAVQVEDEPGLPLEVRIAGEDPAPVGPGLQGILGQRQMVVTLIASTMSRATATRAISERDSRASGNPRSAGRSQASALISTTTRGGKGPRPAAPRAINETRGAILEEPLAPAAHGRPYGPQALRDLVVAQAVRREEHDLGPEDLAPRGRLAPCSPLQLGPLLGRQLDPERAPSGHRLLLSEES